MSTKTILHCTGLMNHHFDKRRAPPFEICFPTLGLASLFFNHGGGQRSTPVEKYVGAQRLD